MKFLFAIFVFVLAIGLTFKATANDNAVTCTPEKSEHCADKERNTKNHDTKENSGHKAHSNQEHHNQLSEKMNSLFPQPHKDANKADRPNQVKLNTPKFLATVSGDSTKLEWTASEGATNYHIQVATDPNFKWLVANDNFVKTNSFEVKQLEPGKKYYWRVASIKNQNDSMFTKSLFASSVFQTK